MSIKQSGGVFGRNPTFNDVTIEGQLTFDGDIDINSDLKIDGDLEVTGISKLTGNVAIGTNLAATTLTVAGNGANGIELDRNLAASAQSARLFFDSSAGGTAIVNYDGDTVFTTGATAGAASGTEKMRISASNVSIASGNLIIGTSGKGIDFSATAGTGTSELFSDYEEGTYTVAVTCSTSGTITVAGAYDTMQYTKVGRMVTVSGLIIMSAISSPVGVLQISLPFAVADLSNRAGDVPATVVINNSVANTSGSYVSVAYEGDAFIRVYEGDATSFGSLSANQIQASSQIWYQATYVAA